MKLAPLPDHGRVGRPEWQALWMQYEAVTTPLRAAGLVCDIEGDGQTVIYAALPDGTHLVIADHDALPDRLEQVTGWYVRRGHHDNPNYDALVFDSTEGGEHEKHGADIVTMLAAIALYLKSLTDADTQSAGTKLGELLLATAQRFAVSFVGVDSQHAGRSQVITGPFDSHAEAVKEYGWQTHLLKEGGWQMVHEQGGTDWPLTVWQRRDVLQVVFVSRQPLL
ncbi:MULTISPECIES: hypothetical protein [unclassified Streptomyces]|uniref:hypothetical protein n=1 Tax=unclassified Streptomyces TaxID=2593676 RepID=UPI002E809989|nr:hypothetical protein [Streptomyces sp. NBC_00589]WTI37422.1 hypothetical protein OIC96_21600 [Streptomyces sp. NBC_00775]WUB28901.1 hypothetical protein OHA51_28135 [Streptomyces sp. NBC_00589]